MEEPILKKKSTLDRIVHNQIFITIFSFIMVFIVIVGSSYAIFNYNGRTELDDIVITSGDLQVVVSSDSEMLNLNYTTLGVNDTQGLTGEEYTFNIENISSTDIEYYEIRIVDAEYEISTLPHKAIRFVINKNDEGYIEPLNLADCEDYIYFGGPLEVGETDTFKFKMWVSEELGSLVNNKVMHGSLEVTLYQKVPSRSHIIYDVNGGIGYVPKTRVASKKISSIVPKKDGYDFTGWSPLEDATTATYLPNDSYNEELGTILYAIYKERNVMDTFHSTITDQKANITEVYFINDTQENIDTRYNDATIKADLTYNSQGNVKGWLEVDPLDSTKYILYVGSNGTTYLNTGYYLFREWTVLRSIDFTHIDTSSVTNMSEMFYNCISLTSLDVSNFDTSSVTDMASMFYYCGSLTSLDLSNFDTSSVTTMYQMFCMNKYENSSLTSLDISNFDTSFVTDMRYMFYECRSLTSLDLSNFDTSSVTTMYRMFYECSSLTSLDLSNFDTSSVTSMEKMFSICSSLTSLDISNFDTSSVTNMTSMFDSCSSLTNQDVSNFDTSSVTNMEKMFYYCSSLTSLDVSNFDTSLVTDMSRMFYECSSLTSLDVSNFDTSFVTDMRYMFYNCSSLTNLDVSNFDTSFVTDMRYMFYACKNLTNLDVSNFDTSSVTNMQNMFNNCFSLTNLDVSNFDTSSVTNMYRMFGSCSSLTNLDLSNFDTSSVTNMYYMFYECSSLTSLDLSNFTFNTTLTSTSLSYSSIFRLMPAAAIVTVNTAIEQSWILGLSSSYRPSDWTTSNVVIKS